MDLKNYEFSHANPTAVIGKAYLAQILKESKLELPKTFWEIFDLMLDGAYQEALGDVEKDMAVLYYSTAKKHWVENLHKMKALIKQELPNKS